MLRQGSRILEILRRKEKEARLRFWDALVRVVGGADTPCPFMDELPEGAVSFGPMPKKMRGAFMQAYTLRSAERRSEAEVFEEAISDLLQEHFRAKLEKRHASALPRIEHFRIGKDWVVYAVPIA